MERENSMMENFAVMSMKDMTAEDCQTMSRYIMKAKLDGTYTEDTAQNVVEWYQKWYLDVSDDTLKEQLNSEHDNVRERAKFLLNKRAKVRENVNTQNVR